MKTVICPGSFDPVTMGHIDIIKRASRMFDKVIVAVLINTDKTPCFSIDERLAFLHEVLADLDNIEIVSFEGLLADYARKRKADAIVKGLRALSDFEYEFQMALTNKQLNSDFETIFFTTNSEYMYLSSSMVRQVASHGGDISRFVPNCICDKVISKLRKV